MKPGDRYLKIVEWSEEDQCYVGTCPGLMRGGIHGDDESEVYSELCQAVAEWVTIHEKDGTPLPTPTAGRDFSGKFVVRIGKDLHRELAVRALREGVSLNRYCARVLREARLPYGSDTVGGEGRRTTGETPLTSKKRKKVVPGQNGGRSCR